MARGPIPVERFISAAAGAASAKAASSAETGVFYWLNLFYRALPPIARVALASQVRMWAEKAERDAQVELAREQFPGVYDTTGQHRP